MGGSNISPLFEVIVQLTGPGTYQTACKPGMVGDGIRGDFHGDRRGPSKIDSDGQVREAADSCKRYVNSQTDALIRPPRCSPTRSRRETSPKPGPSSRSRAPTGERIEPVAESFPDLDPHGRICARPTWPAGGPASTPPKGCGSPACNLTARWPISCSPTSRNSTPGSKGPQMDHRFHPDRRRRTGLLDGWPPPRSPVRKTSSSHTDLWDFNANVRVPQTAVASVRPILDERNPRPGQSGSTTARRGRNFFREVPRRRRLRVVRQGHRPRA